MQIVFVAQTSDINLNSSLNHCGRHNLKPKPLLVEFAVVMALVYLLDHPHHLKFSFEVLLATKCP